MTANWLSANIRAWRERYGIVPPHVQPTQTQLLLAKNGSWTAKMHVADKELMLHSVYNPEREAERLVDGYQLPATATVVVFGFACGYHVAVLLARQDSKAKVLVIETDIGLFDEVMAHVDCSMLLSDSRLELIVSDDVAIIAQAIRRLQAEHQDACLIVHAASLAAIQAKQPLLAEWLQNWQVQRYAAQAHRNMIDDNIQQNLTQITQAKPVDQWFNRLRNMPLAVIAAGPSLDLNVSQLYRFRDKITIMAVGTALKPLQQNGVQPDFVVMTDPFATVCGQLDGVTNFSAPLIFLPSLHPQALRSYQGPKFLALQEGVEWSEYRAVASNCALVRTGGSVATTALDIAIRMEANPIILVGQDLAFTDFRSHAKGSAQAAHVQRDDYLWVPGVKELQVPTSRTLRVYQQWIEQRIAEPLHTQFINCTEGGAYINGMRHCTLREALTHYGW